jgi:hypothetical protein
MVQEIQRMFQNQENLKKMNKRKKIRIITIALVAVLIVAVAIAGFFFFSMSNPLTNSLDPKDMALSLSDISTPGGLMFNSNLSVATYKNDNYWDSESQKQAAIAMGFTSGYYDYFFYQDSPSSNNIKVIGSSIAIFNQSAQEIMNKEAQSFNTGQNCIFFSVPSIGDNSLGCHMIITLPNLNMSYYNVFFYKNNVLVRTFVGQTGLADSSTEAIKYANIVAGRI